jgi:hypothetical protein
MNWLRNVGLITAAGLLAASFGCGGSTSSTTAPSAPTFVEMFSGTVVQGSSDPHAFTIRQASTSQPGNIDAVITSIGPLSTITVGLGLGVWDATAQSCSLQISSNAAKLNLTLSATISAPGDICVAVYDVGNITDTITYTVQVTHT